MPAAAAVSSAPTTMTAIKIVAPGGPEALVPETLPVPQPKSGEILVKVAAAGVNYPDVMQRKGGYPPPPGAPETPGLEVAGEVVTVGPDAGPWKIGDQVCALVAGGGYAEYCAVPAPQALPVPKGFDMVMAAAVPETFFTVWVNLFDRGRLVRGETVLVHGGSGGIGSAAIQVAHAFGARVFTTARTAEKCRACEAMGAERAINYREEDFVDVALKATGGRGVDLVLDIIGGDYLVRNFKALAVEGRLVQVALQGGGDVNVPLFVMMRKRLTITGSTLRPRPVPEKGRIAAALREHVWPLFDAGKIKPLIYKTFPLRQAAQAHALMESSDHIGKIVLTV